MAKKKLKGQIILIAAFFLIYFILAARTVPKEIILTPKWINLLETEDAVILNPLSAVIANQKQIFPFTLGYHFGYIDASGSFAMKKINNGNIYLSEKMWTEYNPEPSNIEINNIEGEVILTIENTWGYPVLLDDRIFILGSEQNSLSEIDHTGNIAWTYDFGSILTSIDASSNLIVTGSIDGLVEILDSDGLRVYFFQPGGSRIETIYGCAISENGMYIGIVSGIDPQRFLLLEKYDAVRTEYRVIYHEFLDRGFRRPVHIKFIDNDRRIVFERQGGINCFNIKARKSSFIALDGELAAVEDTGDNRHLFVITNHSRTNPHLHELIGIRLSRDRRFSSTQDEVFLKAPFKSEAVYLYRTKTVLDESLLVVGGGGALISFNLERK